MNSEPVTRTIALCCIALGICCSVLIAQKSRQETAETHATVANAETDVSQQKTQHRNKDPQQKMGDPLDVDFYRTIIDNNLFRPLGWNERPKSYTDYRLLGTITESEGPSLAVLQERRSKRTHIVTLGDTLGDFHVFRIQHKQVTLRKGNQLAILTLEDALFLSPTPRVETEPN